MRSLEEDGGSVGGGDTRDPKEKSERGVHIAAQ